jgi:hypothetical protein
MSLFNRKLQWTTLLSRWRWRCIYRALSRNYPLGLDSNSGQLLSGPTRHYPIMGFCEVYLNFGVSRVGPDIVLLKVSVCG